MNTDTATATPDTVKAEAEAVADATATRREQVLPIKILNSLLDLSGYTIIRSHTDEHRGIYILQLEDKEGNTLIAQTSEQLHKDVMDKYLHARTARRKLSKRHEDVLVLRSQGYTTKEIAQKLCVSPKTIDSHCVAIYRKLSITHLHELIKYAIRYGYIEL